MKTAVQYLAFDVHQSTCTAVVRDPAGRIRIRAVVETNARAVLDFVGGLRGEVWVAFEEGTQAQWLYDLLSPHVKKVVVCDVRHARAKLASKSDQIDAEWLSEMLRLGSLRAVFHESQDMLTLKELVRNYTAFVDDSVRVMLRLKAIFRGRAILAHGRGVWNPKRREEWLQQVVNAGARFRASQLFSELETLQLLRKQAKDEALREARRHKASKLLQSFPYVGPVRSAEILAIVRSPFRFRTKHQLWPYIGLAVVTRSSSDHEVVDGEIRRKRRRPMTRGLNQNCNHTLKKVFKSIANDMARGKGAFRLVYDRLLSRGIKPDLAKLTLARKVAACMLAAWKKGVPYDPTKLTPDSA